MKARLPKGMGGGPGNMNDMIRKAQKMQEQMEAFHASLAEREFTAAAGGGAVKVTLDGTKLVKSLELAPEAVDPDDIEMLQDLIIAAVNEAQRTADEAVQAEEAKITGSLSVPGMF